MDDDERYLDLAGWDDDDEAPRRSRLRGCIFLGVTLILIAALAGSSVIAWFVVTHRETAESLVRESAGLAPVSTSPPRQPTAAPATVVAALPTAAPTAALESTPDGPVINRIVLINANNQVETLSPTGEDRRVLTRATDETFFQYPTWSPAGDRVAVIGSDMGGSGIYVLPDTEGIGKLEERGVYFSVNETPFYLYWSPDSQNLAFLANQSRNEMGLKVVPGDGASDSRLLAKGTPFYWHWTDDGRQLLVHRGLDRSQGDLSLIDVEGETQAGNLASPGAFQAPGIAPGGRYWAIAEEAQDGLSALVVVDTQTGERRPYEEAGSLALSWSPTRDQVAYINGRVDGHPYWGPLQVLDVASGQTRLLSRQTVLAFFWSPDGRSIAFITISRDEDDGGINAGLPAKERVLSRRALPVQQGQGFLTLSVVDVDTGQGLRLIDFEPTASYIGQFLPFFDQYALSHRVWSPDSSAVVLPVREDSGNVVLIVPTRGGRPQRLAEGDIAFWSQR